MDDHVNLDATYLRRWALPLRRNLASKFSDACFTAPNPPPTQPPPRPRACGPGMLLRSRAKRPTG
eukprot:4631679-Pyramimonas_sp.AAC.1